VDGCLQQDKEHREFYISILTDRGRGGNVIVYSPDGGMDIEKVAEETPGRVFTEFIDPLLGLRPFQAQKVAFNLGLGGQAFKEMVDFVLKLYAAFTGSDASLFEINPCLKTSDDHIIAVDSKVTLDDNALFRHKDLEALRDTDEEDPADVEAQEYDLNYVKLDGNVGCMVNGAGLAMPRPRSYPCDSTLSVRVNSSRRPCLPTASWSCPTPLPTGSARACPGRHCGLQPSCLPASEASSCVAQTSRSARKKPKCPSPTCRRGFMCGRWRAAARSRRGGR
jgi:hypothetical protein